MLGFGFFLRWSFPLKLLQKHYMDYSMSLPHFYPHLTWWVLLGVKNLGDGRLKHTHAVPLLSHCPPPPTVSALMVPWVKCFRKTPWVQEAARNMSTKLWEIICQMRKRRPHLSLWKSTGGIVLETRYTMLMTDKQRRLQKRCLNESSILLDMWGTDCV